MNKLFEIFRKETNVMGSKNNLAKSKKIFDTRTMVTGAILTALVVVLQLMGSFIKLGPFSISLVLVPIVIGAATCGPTISTWLGFVFGVAVLLSGDAAAFLAINPFGTVVTVLLKGAGCGLVAGFMYKLVEKEVNKTLGVILSALICPIVNTSIFLAGCYLFFFDTIKEWGAAAGFENVGSYMILGLVGLNFVVELAVNILLSPGIVTLLNIRKKSN